MKFGKTMMAAGAAALLAFAAPAPQAAAQFSSADSAAIVNYRLTEQSVAQFRQAMRNLVALDSASMESFSNMGENSQSNSLQAVADQLNGIAPVRGAIESAGMTTRDWMNFMMALVFATTVTTLEDNGMAEGAAQLKKYVSAENIRFYREHKAELEALMAEMEALSNEEDEHEGGHDHH